MTLTLALPIGEFVYTGRQVTFKAPCESEGLTGVIVDGVEYALVNAMGTALVANSFDTGAMVSVIFDVENKKAYVQNADTNAYLEGKLAEKYSPQNKPSAANITAGTFAGQVVANASGQSPSVSCLRNSKFSFDESDVPTVEGETVWYLK